MDFLEVLLTMQFTNQNELIIILTNDVYGDRSGESEYVW